MTIIDELKQVVEEDKKFRIRYNNEWSPFGKLDMNASDIESGAIVLTGTKLRDYIPQDVPIIPFIVSNFFIPFSLSIHIGQIQSIEKMFFLSDHIGNKDDSVSTKQRLARAFTT